MSLIILSNKNILLILKVNHQAVGIHLKVLHVFFNSCFLYISSWTAVVQIGKKQQQPKTLVLKQTQMRSSLLRYKLRANVSGTNEQHLHTSDKWEKKYFTKILPIVKKINKMFNLWENVMFAVSQLWLMWVTHVFPSKSFPQPTHSVTMAEGVYCTQHTLRLCSELFVALR